MKIPPTREGGGLELQCCDRPRVFGMERTEANLDFGEHRSGPAHQFLSWPRFVLSPSLSPCLRVFMVCWLMSDRPEVDAADPDAADRER